MTLVLTDHEVRLLGCLLEKEMATPDYYPLTLNALINACNQKSNRNPVVSFDEKTVLYGLNALKEKKMIRQSNISRVPKFEQLFSNKLNLLPREKAVICILLLRGPQTSGEIRSRTERLYSFKDLEEVQQTLDDLEDAKLTMKLPRQPGRKEPRYSHLLSSEPGYASAQAPARPESSTVIVRKENDRAAELQDQIDTLRGQLQKLTTDFERFKSQFE